MRKETEACQETRVYKDLKETRVWPAHLVPLAHRDHLDSRVQLVRKDRREIRVSLVPEEIRAVLAPQGLQDSLQKWLSPCR